MAVYEPLHQFLSNQLASTKKISMAFEQIARILDRSLPYTAQHSATWWTNNPQRHVQAQAWLDAGFSTEDVSLPHQSVTFARK